MEALLLAITIVSLLTAVGSSLLAWRLVRESRERSAARVAALAAEINAEPAQGARVLEGPGALHPVVSTGDPDGMFAVAAREQRPWGPLAPVLLAGLVLLGGIVGSAALRQSDREAGGPTTDAEPHVLELLSLRHSIENGGLSITGLVRNPAGTAPVQQLTAAVFAFDDKGTFLTSGRAPLDFTTLADGEESPFVVTMNAVPGVARYRVSFRRNDGGLIPHVDRREVKTP